ncbi:YxeA family protein [Bacillus sp. FJAT-28004]|uniref:YxeA family protein n=1 Tax=Bacillus sp. FJAT-28004 TaxID=1679165 RepID=UPI0009EC3F32|nr:YxeA family protein [Bacillus sp. FJAT-28004]
MKKSIAVFTIIAVLVVGSIVFLRNGNINRIGADQYYVQVQEGKQVEGKTADGQKFISYEYTSKAYDKDGTEKKLDYTANKSLRKDAYLRVYVKDSGVSSYQEVKQDEIPSKALEKLNGKSGS